MSEINPNHYVGNKSEKEHNSEINPSKLGNKSEKHSEINPTYHNTKYNHNTIDNKKENSFSENDIEVVINPANEEERKKVPPKKEKFNFRKSLLALGVTGEVVRDWLIVRKDKKASNTEIAFKRINSEILKSKLTPNECIKIAVEKSWRGFEASWIKTNSKTRESEQSILEKYESEYSDTGEWSTVN